MHIDLLFVKIQPNKYNANFINTMTLCISALPRGYFVLGKNQHLPLLLFRFATSLSHHASELDTSAAFVNKWCKWLDSPSLDQSDASLSFDAIGNLLQAFSELAADDYLLTTQLDINCPTDVSNEHGCAVSELILDIEHLALFTQVKSAIGETSAALVAKSGVVARENKVCSKRDPMPCILSASVNPAHFISMLILAWPYSKCGPTKAHHVAQRVAIELSSSSVLLQNEVRQLRQQFELVLSYKEKCLNCQCRV